MYEHISLKGLKTVNEIANYLEKLDKEARGALFWGSQKCFDEPLREVISALPERDKMEVRRIFESLSRNERATVIKSRAFDGYNADERFELVKS